MCTTGLNMGAAGCALAMTLASMMSCTMLCAGMVVKDMLRWDSLKHKQAEPIQL